MSVFTFGAGLLVVLLVRAAFGVACALIAQSRGRSAVAWFFIGFFLACFGLIVVLVIPDLKAQQERERRLADENRRLRERLRKDRMVADERHAELKRRVDTHDVALGVDTEGAAVAALPGSNVPMDAPPPGAADGAAAELRAAAWYWAAGQNRQGPIDFGALKGLWREGRLTVDTLVWFRGMAKWSAVRDVPALEDELDA